MNGKTLKTTSTVSAAIASAGRFFSGGKEKLHLRGLTGNRQTENIGWSVFALETIRHCQTAVKEWRATSSRYSTAAIKFPNEAHPGPCGPSRPECAQTKPNSDHADCVTAR